MEIDFEKMRHLRALIEKSATSLTDEEALTGVELFPMWAVNTSYTTGQRIRYSGKLYKVLQDHTSAAQWTPDIAPSLYVEVTPPGEIPVWRQPMGSTDAYMTGDKVHYPTKDDPVYVSTMDNNVWAPDVLGWELVA